MHFNEYHEFLSRIFCHNFVTRLECKISILTICYFNHSNCLHVGFVLFHVLCTRVMYTSIFRLHFDKLFVQTSNASFMRLYFRSFVSLLLLIYLPYSVHFATLSHERIFTSFSSFIMYIFFPSIITVNISFPYYFLLFRINIFTSFILFYIV